MGIGVIIVFGVVIAVYFVKNKGGNTKTDSDDALESLAFDKAWRLILMEKVGFYNSISDEEKARFERTVIEFLSDVRITGVNVEVDDTDRILVAASAIIPTFAFPDWQYTTIDEVLLYPTSFNEKFEIEGDDRRILGMVGDGPMNGTMILSKPALIQGFLNETDKHNTAIHEFVHLIDKVDGAIDGIPEVLLHKQYTLPWLNLISKKIEEINKNKSDINPYGATSQTEFLAVVSEYFFERPQLLQTKHPELYDIMEQMYKQEMSDKKLVRLKSKVGRNDPCPCNKGEKYKNCCGKNY